MKLDKTSIQKFLFTLISVFILFAVVSSASIKKITDQNALAAEAERHRTNLKKRMTAKTDLAVPFTATNNTLSQILWTNLNTSASGQKSEHFKLRARSWGDNKLFDRQLDIIYKDFLHQNEKEVTPQTTKDIISMFTTEFEACDTDKDNVLTLPEFTACFTTDKYLSQLLPPPIEFANYANNSFTNNTGFYSILFDTLDAYKVQYITFYDYMMVRMFVYSWKKCSVMAPFIEELTFECAMDIAAGYKTMSRTSARRVYALALELSNTRSQRELDFISFVQFANSIRLYGLINGRGDEDVTKNEFNAAMDANLLPPRYNQDTINQLYRLVEEHDKPNQGLDLISFVFYDNALKLFDVPNPTRKWYQTVDEFTSCLGSHLFPLESHMAFQRIPQNNITSDSYKMYSYLNISKWRSEDDIFLKFGQKKERKTFKKSVSNQPGTNNFLVGSWLLPKNFTFDTNKTAKLIYNVLDNDLDGYITFYDFGSFMQVAYLFAKYDTFNKGNLYAGDIYEKFSSYSEFPTISYHMRDRARRFNLLSQDVYVDLLRVLTFFRIDDMMDANVRRSDKTSLYEVELKHVFHIINLDNAPDGYLDQCLRGPDEHGVPKYDWECAFLKLITVTVQYLENAVSYSTAISANLTLSNTVFTNIDPQLKK